MDIILFDPENRENLLPLVYTRPVSELRVGIDTIARKWQSMLPGNYSYDTVDYLRPKYGEPCSGADCIHVAGNILPTPQLCRAVSELQPGERLISEGRLVAFRCGEKGTDVQWTGEIDAIDHLYDIFLLNGKQLNRDFVRFTKGLTGKKASSTVIVIGDASRLFIHPEATFVEGCIINVMNGPVYIGAGATVMEGCCLRGPVAVCDNATLKMGAKVYGATTVGPWCKVGGEINNVVFTGYSNKAHDGFLGNAVIGEWCNIGAGCTASNLKNDYTEIKLWNYPAHRFLRTGLQFCGLMMGDHSKAGVNTMLNTATVLGVGVNIHGSGFPRPFLASFSEGSTAGFTDVPMQRFFDIARRMMARRNVELTDVDIAIFNHIRQLAEQYR